MARYEVEFWCGNVVEVTGHDIKNEEQALLRAVEENTFCGEWPGSAEYDSHGACFRVWVREKD